MKRLKRILGVVSICIFAFIIGMFAKEHGIH